MAAGDGRAQPFVIDSGDQSHAAVDAGAHRATGSGVHRPSKESQAVGTHLATGSGVHPRSNERGAPQPTPPDDHELGGGESVTISCVVEPGQSGLWAMVRVMAEFMVPCGDDIMRWTMA